MRIVLLALFSIFAGLFAGAAFAQEGHPLAGSWHGEWHPAGGQATKLVVFMRWDGKNVAGMINPGPNAAPLKTANFQGWNVHLEADTKDNAHVVADGKMDKVGSYHRTITGTWSQGSAKGDFTLTRD